jgi:DNA-binding transcriptional LysR family regulator
MHNPDYARLSIFLAVADAPNFTVAATRLGITRSAVSQAISRLENQLGVALVLRTTRHVRLTETGAHLAAQLRTPMHAVTQALAGIADEATVRGHLRISATSIAEYFLSGPLIAGFAEAYPEITLDITVTDAEDDIVAAGFDVGVRLGEVIEQDMIAVPLGGTQRQVTVASPNYLDRHGRPEHPQDLTAHRCIGWRRTPDSAPYRWEFSADGRDFDVAVHPQVTTNDMLLMIRLALSGGGITFGMEETFQPYIETGQLVSLLDAFLPEFPGFYLYFPSRRNLEPKVRAFIDYCRKETAIRA